MVCEGSHVVCNSAHESAGEAATHGVLWGEALIRARGMANQGSAGGYLCLFFTGRKKCEA